MEADVQARPADSLDSGTLALARRADLTGRAKVFGIGLNKTGTSSLRVALELLGYRVCGPRKDLLKAMRKGDFSGFDPVVEAFDAFEDVPWPLAFEYLYGRYGSNSKFVLTTRSSPERWFRSIENHARTSGLMSQTWLLTYGTYRPFGRERAYIEFYESHNARVRDFFARRGEQHRLLELCFEQGQTWRELCTFLGEPVPDLPFPHANRTDLDRKAFNRALNRIVEPVCRSLARIGGHGAY